MGLWGSAAFPAGSGSRSANGWSEGEGKGAKTTRVVRYPVSEDGVGGSRVTSLPLPFYAAKDGLQLYGVGEDEPGARRAAENCRALSLRLEERK